MDNADECNIAVADAVNTVLNEISGYIRSEDLSIPQVLVLLEQYKIASTEDV